MTSFVLKCIAMITMFIDHLSIISIKYTTFYNVIGRLAFPIFAFQISEGYIHTKNLKKYFLRLFLFAIISQIPFMLFRSFYTKGFVFNIFGTLFLGLTSIFIYDIFCKANFKFIKNLKFNNIINKCFCILFVLLLGIIAEVFHFDYGFFGVIIIFLFYFFKNDKIGMTIFFITACIIKYGLNIFSIEHNYLYLYIFLCLGTIFPIVFINLYNGKQGKKIKYLLYVFYPIHLLILYFIFK